MQSFRLNPILNTDSYKLTHWWQYPADTRHIYSYLESRGGMFDETMLALLQYIIKSNFAGQVFTLDDVEEARRIAHAHFAGHPKSFNYEGFSSSTRSMAVVSLSASARSGRAPSSKLTTRSSPLKAPIRSSTGSLTGPKRFWCRSGIPSRSPRFLVRSSRSSAKP